MLQRLLPTYNYCVNYEIIRVPQSSACLTFSQIISYSIVLLYNDTNDPWTRNRAYNIGVK